MASFNKVILIGNLTRDPELRYTPKGVAIAKIGLAVNRKWRDQESGETKEEVTFLDVDAFGRQAETIAQYVKKGSPLMVEGRLRLDTWEDKQTQQKRSRLGVVLEGFQFLGGGSGGSDRPERPASAEMPRSRPAAPATPSQSADSDLPPDDDVPF